jgi:hypothetical protein
MNRRMCRQVLDWGDGIFGVTALAVAALKIVKRAADTATPTQSGDFEDSVAALQDAGALAAAPQQAAQGPGLETSHESKDIDPHIAGDRH